MEQTPKIAVLMTCFNRREKTLACLRALAALSSEVPRHTEIFLVDDGSKDGTAESVRTDFPDVHLAIGNGSLYWSGGMRVAFEAASARNFDAYMLLNDDTLLDAHAFDVVIKTWLDLKSKGVTAIVAGSTRDSHKGSCTYGGWNMRKGLIRRSLVRVLPDPQEPRECLTMNGNCTLIPAEVVARVGLLDSAFTHSFADFDYGFRAHAAGFRVVVAPGFIGTCNDNPVDGTWRDRSLPLRKRWKHLNSPKGSPLHDWFVYCRRHLGPAWPLYVASPYVKTLVSGMLG